MKKRLTLGFVVILLLVISLPASAQVSEIALVNPGFENEYVTVPGGYAASGWTTHYKEGTVPPLSSVGGGSNPTRRPEFKPIDAKQYPERVAEGDRAQVAFAFYGIMDAAFSQQVAVEKGKVLRFSVQAHGWSTNTDDPNQHTGDVWLSLGIGAEGQTDPWAHGIEWTRYDWTPATYRTYESRAVTAESSTVTLFILVTNKWATKHNDLYLDDARAWYETGGDCQECPPCPECPECQPCPPTGTFDWEMMRALIDEALRIRPPVMWPRP